MFLFLATYILIGLALNLYILRWLRPALGWRSSASRWFAVPALLLTLLPIASRLCDRWGHYNLALVTGLPGYAWMAVILWGVCFGLLAELINAGLRLAALALPSARRFILSPQQVVCAVLAIGGVLSVWGAIEVRTLETETIRIQNPRWPPGTKPVRVVHVSDIHFGPFVGRATLDRLTAAIGRANPDLLLCSGDVFDSTAPEMEDCARALGRIRVPMGKFACLGNHEFYLGIANSMRLLDLAGFKVLRQNCAFTERGGTVIEIAGVDDPAGMYTGDLSLADENVLPHGGTGAFSILLKHQPRIRDDAASPPDLQLSGHTHGGQILPAQVFARLVYPRWRGLYKLEAGRRLYVSRGVGTWGPPIRVLARPQIALFIIEPEDAPR